AALSPLQANLGAAKYARRELHFAVEKCRRYEVALELLDVHDLGSIWREDLHIVHQELARRHGPQRPDPQLSADPGARHVLQHGFELRAPSVGRDEPSYRDR